MAGKKISAQPLVSVVTDAIKMPTGESGDKTISVGQIRSARIASLSIDATATAAGDTVVGSIAISKLYRLLSIVTDQPLRIRLYTTAAARDADLARPSTTEQSQGSSLMLEFVSDAMLLSADFTPTIDGYAPTELVYYSMSNIGASVQDLSCAITYADVGA